MYYIFPDTNIFIHGKDFEEIDWPGWFGQSEVTLVLAPVVIAELDKHKYNPNAKIARRVKKLLPRLEAIIDETRTSRYSLQTILKKPAEETFTKHNLDKKNRMTCYWLRCLNSCQFSMVKIRLCS